MKLKMISSPYCALSRVVYGALFCFMHDVTTSQLLKLSKLKVSKQPPLWMCSGRSFILRSFIYHSMKQLRSWKTSMKLFEKEFERAQRQGMWFVTNNIDSHSIESGPMCRLFKRSLS